MAEEEERVAEEDAKDVDEWVVDIEPSAITAADAIPLVQPATQSNIKLWRKLCTLYVTVKGEGSFCFRRSS